MQIFFNQTGLNKLNPTISLNKSQHVIKINFAKNLLRRFKMFTFTLSKLKFLVCLYFMMLCDYAVIQIELNLTTKIFVDKKLLHMK